ncbi:MAG: M28 family peptidase [Acidobacteriota bacterium]|nr:M28 family peptidase [Acidobacteriota bacterium]
MGSYQKKKTTGKSYRNVSALFGAETKDWIVVVAHYDTAGALTGADDNASGIARLIELAHLLDNTSLPVQDELVAFALEEPPFFRTGQMGSAVHARSLKGRGEVAVSTHHGVFGLGYHF